MWDVFVSKDVFYLEKSRNLFSKEYDFSTPFLFEERGIEGGLFLGQ